MAGRSWARSGMIDGSKKAAARATSRYANIIDCYARRCHSCRRRADLVPLPGSGALGSLAVRSVAARDSGPS